MRFVCPRCIRANRGDLLSRYAILSTLHALGTYQIEVFCETDAHVRPLNYPTSPYGSAYNLVPPAASWCALKQADAVLWTAGLDLQDDSSLLKLPHLWCLFSIYRALGLPIYVLFQGAGPLTTRLGRWLTPHILNRVDTFIVRDSRSFSLLQGLNKGARLLLGHDGLFLEGFKPADLQPHEAALISCLTDRPQGQPLIGFNVRRWYHFANSILPYQYAQRSYAIRSQQRMDQLVRSSTQFLKALRLRYQARVLLLSMYEPGREAWDDDLPYLYQIATAVNDDAVSVADVPLSLHAFCRLIAQLDAMVSVRLHGALIALRQGVPAVNLSYTLKGKAIFSDLGLSDCALDLDDFLLDHTQALEGVERIWYSSRIRARVQTAVQRAIAQNQTLLTEVISGMLPRGREVSVASPGSAGDVFCCDQPSPGSKGDTTNI